MLWPILHCIILCLRCFMLFHIMLYYVMLCYGLSYAISYSEYVVLWYDMICYAILHSTMQRFVYPVIICSVMM